MTTDSERATRYTRIEIESGPDSRGRYTHVRFWLSSYHPGHPGGEYRTAERAQGFFSELPKCAASRAALKVYKGKQ